MFAGAVVLLVLIDAMPQVGRIHRRLKRETDLVLDMTGLWQGSWTLYCPDPDRINTRLTAEILYSDGSRAHWQSLDWTRLSCWERLRTFRRQEYYDNIRFTSNRGAWESLARYLARTVPAPGDGGARPVEVKLSVRWAEIPPPDPAQWVPVGPYTEFNQGNEFYTWSEKP